MKYVVIVFMFCFLLLTYACEYQNAPLASQEPPQVSQEPSSTPHEQPSTSGEPQAEYRRIDAKEAKELMNGDCILLDVRTEEEFKEARIDGAILIPDYEIGERAENELPDKDALILVYCRSGRRSALAANELVNQGYTNVYDFGGIIDWPYDTVSG